MFQRFDGAGHALSFREPGQQAQLNWLNQIVGGGAGVIAERFSAGGLGSPIGAGAVVGAGSVVTKDIPSNSIAAGNPCSVLRTINEHDMKYYYKGRSITLEDLDEEARLR